DTLRALDVVRAAAREWQASKKTGAGMEEGWLAHRGDRLKEAKAIAAREDFRTAADTQMVDYLAACQGAEHKAVLRSRLGKGLALAVALPVLTVGGTSIYRTAIAPVVAKYVKYRPYAKPSEMLAAAPRGSIFQDCRDGSVDCPVMVVLPEGA